jgi:hypothetical protein
LCVKIVVDVRKGEPGVMEKFTVKVVIATHKNYQMPDDQIYLPLFVGADGKQEEQGKEINCGYAKDNTGDNISCLNPSFCELTGLYWAWKNLEEDYIGLVHYRRHFTIKKNRKNLFESVLTYDDLESYLGKVEVFVPKKRKYYIESLYSHYKHTHYSEQLDDTRKIISEKYPEYLVSYDKVIQQRSGYMFNMMIMSQKYLHSYCSWLFDILFALEKKAHISELSAFQGRYYGRISEIIFNVWLDYQMKTGLLKRSQIKEIPYVHMEKINWKKKGSAFLKAKFFGVKYEGSF